MISCLLPEGQEAFYFYIHEDIYMTSGAKLEMVGSPRSVGGFQGVLISFREFLTLWKVMLKKILGAGVVRSWPYLIAKHPPPKWGLM
jgi:hypothetical protein